MPTAPAAPAQPADTDTAAPASPFGVANQYIDKARAFAKAKPAATAALAGVLGLALLNTLRGKR